MTVRKAGRRVRAWSLSALLVTMLSGLPQLALAVEDGASTTGTEELRSIRSLLVGDRVATDPAFAAPSPGSLTDRHADRVTIVRRGAAVPAYVRRGVPPGQPARLGPARSMTSLVRILQLAASSFV